MSVAPTRLQQLYEQKIVPDIMKRHGYKSHLAVPRLSKITLNMGIGQAVADKKKLQSAMEDMTQISGQKPVQTLARKSIAGFKLREEVAIGCKVTIRRKRMYDFLDRLITTALPRSRDFRGLKAKSLDGRGNYSLGIPEQIVFHEIQYEKIDELRGLDVTITTTASDDEQALELLLALGVPIQQQER
ncbi:50S ribosomal protein L5 [Candidatus Persebacteraceae bacterium Df01]|uniref:Large ribosomal subunit protein uL5 n=1 Tax=Candidatus Doriopsillibacter californiensis TaxID=2970740 RepID=A0ABT7QKR8_9GAMM|nr:50S ribosomal protein L5 [Candidatus Persebacteraceae bacterium Df01]